MVFGGYAVKSAGHSETNGDDARRSACGGKTDIAPISPIEHRLKPARRETRLRALVPGSMLVCVKERPGLSPRSTKSRHRDAHPVLGLVSQLIANLQIVCEGRQTQTFAHAVRSLFGSHGYTCSLRGPA